MKWRTALLAAVWSCAAVIAQAQVSTSLVPGTPLEREIRAGEVHTYHLAVVPGQFVHVTATQLGSDVAIRLIQPDGKRFAEVDRLPYEGFEDLPWIAASGGECTIEIRALPKSPVGRYRTSVEVRNPTDQDRDRVTAFVASWIEAEALLTKQNAAASREAASKYEFAAGEWHKAGDPRWEAFALTQWAQLLGDFGEFARAKALLERSIALRRSGDERYSLSVSLNGMGYVLISLGEPQRAIEFYEEALELRRQAGDRLGQAVLLNNIGGVYKRISDFPKAIDFLNRALVMRKEVGDRMGESVTLVALSDVHFVAGDFQAALDSLLEAAPLRAAAGDRRANANLAIRVGNAYYALGDSVHAQQYWNQAEPAFRELGDTTSLAAVLYAKGMDQARTSHHAEAIRSFEEAIALHQKATVVVAAANDLSAVCRSYIAVGQLEKAQERASTGLELSHKSSYKVGAGSAAECLGRVDFAKGNDARARTHFEEAVSVFRSIASREDLAMALGGLAAVERHGGNLREALAFLEEANGLIDTARSQVGDPNLRATYRASRADRLEAQTRLLMELHRREPAAGYQERAFNLAERWQSRSMAEMIQESRADLRQELTADQRRREDGLTAAVTSLQRDLFQEAIPAARQRELKVSLSSAEGALNLFQADLRRAGSRYAAAQYAETLDAASIRNRLLGPDVALIEYALGESESYAWMITQTSVVSAVLPARKEVEQRVESYRKLLSERVSTLTAGAALARLDTEGERLYSLLVEPLEPSLASKKRIVIVPDGALAYLPFETLRAARTRVGEAGTARLIERFSISYAPSASTLAALLDREKLRTKPELSLLVFADPVFGPGTADTSPQLALYRERGFDFSRLPNTRQEAAGIRSQFPPAASHSYLGAEASEKSLRTEKLDAYRFLHFAVHGYFDEEQPSRSGLILSTEQDGANDGILQSPEIMRLRLNADLVTLSACQTGLGKVLAGEGVMGLTRAFFYAGAQSLVVSLWNVNDAATSELMKRFYVNLKTGLRRDEALRQAKLALMRMPGSSWRHPYYWAPFVFVGDPGQRQ